VGLPAAGAGVEVATSCWVVVFISHGVCPFCPRHATLHGI
jgi:hypothetical protein